MMLKTALNEKGLVIMMLKIPFRKNNIQQTCFKSIRRECLVVKSQKRDCTAELTFLSGLEEGAKPKGMAWRANHSIETRTSPCAKTGTWNIYLPCVFVPKLFFKYVWLLCLFDGFVYTSTTVFRFWLCQFGVHRCLSPIRGNVSNYSRSSTCHYVQYSL